MKAAVHKFPKWKTAKQKIYGIKGCDASDVMPVAVRSFSSTSTKVDFPLLPFGQSTTVVFTHSSILLSLNTFNLHFICVVLMYISRLFSWVYFSFLLYFAMALSCERITIKTQRKKIKLNLFDVGEIIDSEIVKLSNEKTSKSVW